MKFWQPQDDIKAIRKATENATVWHGDINTIARAIFKRIILLMI